MYWTTTNHHKLPQTMTWTTANHDMNHHKSPQITINHDMNHHKSPQTMTWTTMNHDINHHKPWHESLLITTNHDMNHHDDPKRALHKAIWLPCWDFTMLWVGEFKFILYHLIHISKGHKCSGLFCTKLQVLWFPTLLILSVNHGFFLF